MSPNIPTSKTHGRLHSNRTFMLMYDLYTSDQNRASAIAENMNTTYIARIQSINSTCCKR